MAITSVSETLKHIKNVRKFLYKVIKQLEEQGKVHDASKLESPELEIFDEYTPKLRNTTYGSDEYKQYLKEMQVALDHHYANNRHHPEHFSMIFKCEDCGELYAYRPAECKTCAHTDCFVRICSVDKMNLVDIIEMFCDWKAATLRHGDGDIMKSIEINAKRFNMSDELKQILINTVEILEK